MKMELLSMEEQYYILLDELKQMNDDLQIQKFQKYKMSIIDNVIISDHTLEDRDGTAFHQCMEKFDMELKKEKFAELAQGRTALIVTHRIGLTKIADRIMVMDQGKLVQMGTYNELAAAGGKLWELLKRRENGICTAGSGGD